jgi:hypothetical protein
MGVRVEMKSREDDAFKMRGRLYDDDIGGKKFDIWDDFPVCSISWICDTAWPGVWVFISTLLLRFNFSV